MCSCQEGTCLGACSCGCDHLPPVSWAADVRRIALEATAHNSGGTIVKFAMMPGPSDVETELVLEMSSWPRMREAKVALEHAGYAVEESVEPLTLWVMVGLNGPPTSREPEVVEAWLRS
jgi:hypothetical protein